MILLYVGLSVWSYMDQSTLIADIIGQAQLHVALGATCFAALLALVKQKRNAALLLCAALLNMGWVVFALYHPAHTTSQKAFSLLAYNVWINNQQHREVIDIVRSADAEVVWLHEVSNALYHDVIKELKPYYPYIYPEYMKSKGSLLLTKMPHEIHYVKQHNHFLKHATLTYNDAIIDVIGLHLTSPKSNERVRTRNEQLDIVTEYIKEHVPDTRSLIVAGDFNSAPWRPVFKHFIDDTQLHYGIYDILLSWPTFSLYPFMFPIDHIMAKNSVCVSEKFRLPNGGSDHYPVLAQLHYCN